LVGIAISCHFFIALFFAALRGGGIQSVDHAGARLADFAFFAFFATMITSS
jgi:hypothetical protein